MTTADLEFHELTTPAEIAGAYDLMAVLRPTLPRESFVEQVTAQQREGYRLVAARASGQLVALAGYRLSLTLFRGPHLFVDDLVTAPAEQAKGYGVAMLRHLAKLAATHGISRVWLDSRDTARTFYEKVGFTTHTSTVCSIDVNALR
jgi:GNAT superfamily N-acetyltransferase